MADRMRKTLMPMMRMDRVFTDPGSKFTTEARKIPYDSKLVVANDSRTPVTIHITVIDNCLISPYLFIISDWFTILH